MENTVKIGIRVTSSFHEVVPDAVEAYCAFAEMLKDADGSKDDIREKEARALTEILRGILTEPDSVDADYYTEGELCRRGRQLEIRYVEPEGAGTVGGTWTCISFDLAGGAVMIARSGPVNMTLAVEQGVRHGGEYIAPGGFRWELYTVGRRVKNTVTESGGELELGYVLEAPAGLLYNKVTAAVRLLDAQGGL